MATQLSPNFTLEQLTHTNQSADNTPNAKEKEKLTNLCNQILEPIRSRYGKPIKINSGFRSKAVNKAVSGATNSQHCLAEAADIEDAASRENNDALFNTIKSMIENCELTVGQLIWEYGNNKRPNWVHVSLPYRKVNDIFRIK